MLNYKDQPPTSRTYKMPSKKERRQALQREAYYDVLHVFKAESLALSDARLKIINALTKEWNITQESRAHFEKRLEYEPLVRYLRMSTYEDSISYVSTKLPKLQRRAYYSVLHAFKAESLTLSQARIKITNSLMKEWNITQDTRADFEKKLEYQPLVEHLREVNEKKRKLSAIEVKSTCEDSSVLSWGHVSPESLVDKWIDIRLPNEADYIPFHIKAYNPQEGTHHLVAAFSPADFDDPCDWIDIRHAEQINWHGENPGFPVQKRVLKPGETLLRTTSTARNKKRLTEDGVPILKTPDGMAVVTSSPSPIPASGSNWDSGAAECLIGQHIRLLMPGEVEKEDFVIDAYDTKQEVHHIVKTDPNAMEMDELLNWIDFREVAPEDIEWKAEAKPKFYAPKAQRSLFGRQSIKEAR